MLPPQFADFLRNQPRGADNAHMLNAHIRHILRKAEQICSEIQCAATEMYSLTAVNDLHQPSFL